MEFVPASTIIGIAHRVRTVRLAGSSTLPDGEYAFVDFYCKDVDCDCRKAMIWVMVEDMLNMNR